LGRFQLLTDQSGTVDREADHPPLLRTLAGEEDRDEHGERRVVPPWRDDPVGQGRPSFGEGTELGSGLVGSHVTEGIP
jgi:hypothetical protein